MNKPNYHDFLDNDEDENPQRRPVLVPHIVFRGVLMGLAAVGLGLLYRVLHYQELYVGCIVLLYMAVNTLIAKTAFRWLDNAFYASRLGRRWEKGKSKSKPKLI
ncbi:MAG: hypothetical protein AB7G06_02375 [Bdellovibrionales bacterium]